jgi:hypothetical protein
MNIMGKTLVAIFDAQGDAQQAHEAVIDSGFSSRTVRLTFSDSSSDMANGPKSEESIGDKIANFFGFGDQDETYSEAVRRGSYVLTVDADSDEECERAQDIIEEYDPVDIDEREAEWRESGWQGSQESNAQPSDEFSQAQDRPTRRSGVRVLSRFTEAPVERSLRPEFDRYTGPERRRGSAYDYAGIERRAA